MNPKAHTNQLIHESSPYLLQHAHNPVNWYLWGTEALTKAKLENKLLLISIGYSACHWCHVMEKETFENEKIAEIMNQNYVCIKVDREERPDIDQIYMEAVQLMNGNGGWPLNCFALPDSRPVYGGTYFKPEQWEHVIGSLSLSYKADKQKFEQFAIELLTGIVNYNIIDSKLINESHSEKDIEQVVEPWSKIFDLNEGGTIGAPKFPMPASLNFLLEYYYFTKDNQVYNHLLLSLKKMGQGGIYDQVGGGFARYSVDELWRVPHFEKMLYDNAQLVFLYSKSYQLIKDELFKNIVYQTLEFIERELLSPDGGFYSSLDADSEGEEGKFYVWEKREIDELLKKDSQIYCDFYNISDKGNWEHKKNIPYISNNNHLLSIKYNISEDQLFEKISSLNKILLKEREKRTRPGLDDKILCSWNALMIKGFISAYRVFGEQHFLEIALKNALFVEENMISSDFSLYRNYKNGKPSIKGFLDDYAFAIDAFIELYQATFDEKWLMLSKKLCIYTIENFHDEKSGMFFYTSKLGENLIVRKMEIHDNVIASSNSVMANNLFVLGHYFYDDNYIKIASQMLSNVKDDIKSSGIYYSNWARLLLKFIYPPHEISITGQNIQNFRESLDQKLFVNSIIAGTNSASNISILKNHPLSDKTAIYVCQNRVCKMPVFTVEEALKLLD